jgi:hypothetical protein
MKEYKKRYNKMVESDEEHPEVVHNFLEEAKAAENKAASEVNKAKKDLKKGE